MPKPLSVLSRLLPDRYALAGCALTAAALAACALVFGLPGSESAYSTGSREGRVTVFERRGWGQSWEGELQRFPADVPWEFSVEDGRADVIETLAVADATGSVVRVDYRQVWLSDPTRFGSDKRIEGVKVVTANVLFWRFNFVRAKVLAPAPAPAKLKRKRKWWPWR